MKPSFISIWETQHPEYKQLTQENENREVLEWAHKHKYIVLANPVPGLQYYTEFDLEVAKMWKEKVKEDA